MNKTKEIKICKEMPVSYHKILKKAKIAILENSENKPKDLTDEHNEILDNYVRKNIVKKDEHLPRLMRIAIPIDNKWPTTGRTLTIGFLGGEEAVKNKIIDVAAEWMNHCNIELKFIENPNADVRIAFDYNDGSWSYVGTDLLGIDKDKPTMNFGWLYADTKDEEYQRVVLHEFGHTLGCIHEHSQPDANIPWDKPQVYEYYRRTNGWSKEDVDQQVFAKYVKGSTNYTSFDKDSIMLYAIDNSLTLGDFEIGWNTKLSTTDKSFIGKQYPKSMV